MRRTITSALLGGAAATGGGAIKLDWSDCGDSSTHGHITSLSPASVSLGTKTSIVGKGSVDEKIQAASYKVVAKEGFIPIFSHSGDACKPDTIKLPAGTGEIDWKGFNCPISPGAVEVALDLTLSSAIPAKLARVTIELTAQSDTGDKALCAKVNTSPENLIEGVDTEGEAVLRDYASYDFDTYVKDFKKTYGREEFQQRKALFQTNFDKIVQHNDEYKVGKHSWHMTVNELTDSSPAEFAKLRATHYSPSSHPIVSLETAAAPNPDSLDWRTKGVVTEVKNQGGCGSCWAFSATESVESAYAIATKKLLTLAPQTYVNCVKNPNKCGGTGGCEGATMELAFNMTADTGIALESDLPYQGVDEPCKAYKAAVKVSGYVKNPVNNALALETAVATKGPQSITVAADPWMMYGGGIFDGCSKSSGSVTLDHGVQLVGYTKDAWIVRNSWGRGWGEKGYIRLSRASDSKTFTDSKPTEGVACYPYPKKQTVGGECGILFDTSYPTGAALADLTVVV